MSRILLVFPPSAYRNHTPPLNLAYLAAVLEAQGAEVRILDLSALHPPCSPSDAIREAVQFKPLWIGITLNVIFIKPAYEFIQTLRETGIPIVAGGPHPSLLAEEVLLNGCDIVVRGEGEQTVVDLNRALLENRPLSSVHGLVYRDESGQIHQTPARDPIRDLDTLPFPAKHLFPREWYVKDSATYQTYGAIFSGRGCPAACTYCYKGVFGCGCRFRSADNVFAEMRYLNQTYGVTAFEFMDDAFSADLERVDRLCDLIIETPDFPIRWQCTTRLDLTNSELLTKMKRSGCFRIFYGVESGDPDTLFRVNKHLDLRQAEQVLKWTHDAGIRSIVGFMWGFPWDSPASVRASINFLHRVAPFVEEFNPLGLLIPVPGTRLYEDIKERYGIEAWWLQDRFGSLYRDNIYFPYFQRRFYNDFALLDDGFFPYPSEVRRLIRQGTHFIGRHNLFRNTPILKAIVVYLAVLLSKSLFRLHPALEKQLFSLMSHVPHHTGCETDSVCK
ncbi:B12-binding domain-containing radical SAM protein [bacterium]|nr:B12-binding domain-containing radical SAM protein [candidate division CSSED10-310 bacterium]